MALSPVDRHLIAGVQIDDHRFIGRVKTTQLFQIAPDPRDTENRRKVDANKELQELWEIREEVQRLFSGAKAKNVAPYAEYIVQVHHGQDGLTPTIVLCRGLIEMDTSKRVRSGEKEVSHDGGETPDVYSRVEA
jgi:DNA sulfur modification protein DndB